MSVQNLRDMVFDDDLLVVPCVYDGLSAKIAKDVGYDGVYLGGFATGAALASSEPLTTMTEMCQRGREITHSVDLPLVVDGGAGFGNPANVYRAVQEFAKNGIGAIQIEDQVYPKRLHYHAGKVHVTSADKMIQKVEVAARAKKDMEEDILLIARSDSVKAGESIEESVNRVNQYLDAGAEVGKVFPETKEDLVYAIENVDGPLFFTVNETRNPRYTVEELDELGVAMAVVAVSPTIIAAKALYDHYQAVYDMGENPNLGTEEASELYDWVNEVIGLEKYYEIEEATDLK